MQLKPCPFCGGEAFREDIDPTSDNENAGASYICCKKCWATTALHFDRKENLEAAWNERTPTNKRFLLFKGEIYYPCGGWDDFVGSFDTANEARAAIGKMDSYKWYQIIDADDGAEIENG